MPLYSFHPETSSVLLDVETPIIRSPIAELIEDEGFSLKSEYNVTIVHTQVGERMGLAKLQKLYEALGSTAHLNMQYGSTIYKLVKPKIFENIGYQRESLVVPVLNPDLREDLAQASAEAGV